METNIVETVRFWHYYDKLFTKQKLVFRWWIEHSDREVLKELHKQKQWCIPADYAYNFYKNPSRTKFDRL